MLSILNGMPPISLHSPFFVKLVFRFTFLVGYSSCTNLQESKLHREFDILVFFKMNVFPSTGNSMTEMNGNNNTRLMFIT